MQCKKCSLEYNRIHGVTRCPSCYGSSYDLTLHEIGEVLGCTRERVRQIEERATLKIKAQTVKKGSYARAIKDSWGDIFAPLERDMENHVLRDVY